MGGKLMRQHRRLTTWSLASISFLILTVNAADAAVALGRAGCQPDYGRCQQTCKDNSAGGRNYGVSLWDASRSKACFQGCSSQRNACNLAVNGKSATEKRKY